MKAVAMANLVLPWQSQCQLGEVAIADASGDRRSGSSVALALRPIDGKFQCVTATVSDVPGALDNTNRM
jgi:hypothetical protein